MTDDALAQIKAKEAEVKAALARGAQVVRMPEQFCVAQVGGAETFAFGSRIYVMDHVKDATNHEYRVLRLIYDPAWFQTTDIAPLELG